MMHLLIAYWPRELIWLYALIGAIAAFTDLLYGKIYNWLTLPAISFGLCLAAYAGVHFSLNYFWSALYSLGLVTIIFLPFFAFDIFGAGDIKLLMVFALVLGSRGTWELIFSSIVLGSIMSVILLIKYKRVKVFFRELYNFLKSIFVPKLEVQWPKLSKDIKAPFGVSIFFGYLWVIFNYVR